MSMLYSDFKRALINILNTTTMLMCFIALKIFLKYNMRLGIVFVIAAVITDSSGIITDGLINKVKCFFKYFGGDCKEEYKAKTDIIWLIDSSSNVNKSNYDMMLNFAAGVTQYFSINKDNAQFAAVVYGSEARKLFDLKTFQTSDAITAALIAAPRIGKTKLTSNALTYIRQNNLFGSDAGGRRGAHKILVLLVHVGIESGGAVVETFRKLKDQKMTVICVGVGKLSKSKLSYLADVASTRDDVYFVESGKDLGNLFEKFQKNVCEVAKT
ncbi:hypothetical protein Btru_037361 [Bulinus truncatus]|nr:hypothetical protein Btru_037361 [Bulinus truncatus]